MYIFIIIECCIAILALFILIAVAASLKKCPDKNKLYDPYGLYAPITAEQLADIDKKAAEKYHRPRQ